MTKVAFVILHYRTFDDTVECVQSIHENVIFDPFDIIVVDNGSDNNSGALLQEKYKDHPSIIIILNEKNLGMAEGNNIGYNYARKELKTEFIFMINNDTVIEQPDFISKTLSKFKNYKYHLLGPDIIAGEHKVHQNPRFETLDNPQILGKFLRHYRRMLLLNYLGLDLFAEKIKKKIIPASNLPTSIKPDLNPDNKEMYDVKLHGSAIVFSPLYIEKYDYGFYPGTFMYSEESILNFIVRRDKLKTIYYPSVKIYHKEDSATDTLFKRESRKRRFYYRNFINSGRILLNLMNQSTN
jgi:GT2 family glycosyltransferase